MATKLSSEQSELERKLERNRAAFEAWLERKKEEQRVKKKFNTVKKLLGFTPHKLLDIAIHLVRKLLQKKEKLRN